MKKTLFIMMVALTLAFVGCDRQSKSSGIAAPDLVIENGGNLSFYGVESDQLTPFKAETDSVVCMAFVDANQLFYMTSDANKNLKLKKIDFGSNGTQPKLCCDLGIKVSQSMDYMLNGVFGMFFDQERTCVMVPYVSEEEEYYFDKAKRYDIASGRLSIITLEEFSDLCYYEDFQDRQSFNNEDGYLYYDGPQGSRCLNDQIDFEQVFIDADEEELDDLDFYPNSMSPDGTKVAYSAMIPWGEGWGYYCFASLDGETQALLEGSDIWDIQPEWLADGSLVYVSGDSVVLMKSPSEVKVLAPGKKFAVRP